MGTGGNHSSDADWGCYCAFRVFVQLLLIGSELLASRSASLLCTSTNGLLQELSPGPLAPEARIMPLDQAAICTASGHTDCRRLSLSKNHVATTVHIEAGRNRRMVRPPSWQLGVCGSTPGAGPEHGVLGTGQGPPGAPGKTIVSSFVFGFSDDDD